MASKGWILGNTVPKYCKNCGRKLYYVSVGHEYNMLTGLPVKFKHNLYCPEAKKHTHHSDFTWFSKKEYDL